MTLISSDPMHGKRSARPPHLALLRRLFAKVTSQTTIGEESDFVDLGGNDFAAMVLVTELRHLGWDLPLDTLYACRTPAAIAAALASPAQADRYATPRPILFVIPGSGGDNPGLAALRADWSGLLNCVLLDYPEWPRLAHPAFGMDELQADLIRRILDRNPDGPVLLAGYSLGGFVGWEVAKRLLAMGRPVQALLIVDADNRTPIPLAPPANLGVRLSRVISRFVTVLSRADHAEIAEMLGEVIGFRIVGHPRLLRLLARFRHIRLPAGVRYRLRWSVSADLQGQIVRSWQWREPSEPVPLHDTQVTLFRSAGAGCEATPALGWQKRCTNLSIVDVTGDHQSMLHNRGPGSLHAKLPELLFNIIRLAQELSITQH